MEKNLDAKGRWRNRNVGFRVSEEEAKLLDNLVELSGLAKQDYILRRLLNREVVVQGNPKVFKALKHQMAQIYEELKRLEDVFRVMEIPHFYRNILCNLVRSVQI